ncbi:MAG: cupin domain-containing protein [Verrucomicrobiota bacterium]
MKNIFTQIGAALDGEQFDDLLKNDQLRIERIVSNGQASPPDFWYDQDQNEWVVVLEGAAGLEVDHNGKVETVTLERGDCFLLPAGRRHRVAWTSEREKTVWLAVWWPENG